MKSAAEHYQAEVADLFITTIGGRQFYFSRPQFFIDEIAHAISNQCRWGGHCEVFYPGACHSIHVSRIMAGLRLGDPFEGLMHDAHEAYVLDMPAPWKAMLPDYKAMEKRLESEMRKQFGLPATITEGCKRADWLSLLIEAEAIVPSRGADFFVPPGLREQAAAIRADYPIEILPPEMAREAFLHEYRCTSRQ